MLQNEFNKGKRRQKLSDIADFPSPIPSSTGSWSNTNDSAPLFLFSNDIEHASCSFPPVADFRKRITKSSYVRAYMRAEEHRKKPLREARTSKKRDGKCKPKYKELGFQTKFTKFTKSKKSAMQGLMGLTLHGNGSSDGVSYLVSLAVEVRQPRPTTWVGLRSEETGNRQFIRLFYNLESLGLVPE